MAATAIQGMDELVGEQDIQGFIAVLERHQQECVDAGRYHEAALASARLKQLREQEDKRRLEELQQEQLAERLGIEEAHMAELREFNAHAESLAGMLGERHEQELAAQMNKIKEETMARPQWSRELLNMRKIEKNLAKQKKYEEAADQKDRADGVERIEGKNWEVKRGAQLGLAEKKFVEKQQMEMKGLLKRVAAGREEQRLARKQELERLLQRYHNVKLQVESQQKVARQRHEKYKHDYGSQTVSQFGLAGGSTLTNRATDRPKTTAPSKPPRPMSNGVPARDVKNFKPPARSTTG